MAIEIELKAWVDDPEATRKSIASFAAPGRRYSKDDAYWRFQGSARPSGRSTSAETEPGSGTRPGGPGLGSGIRIRREDPAKPSAVVNFKRKEVRDGIEVNDEREFEVSDATVFGELLSRLGLEPWMRKRKAGESWTWDDITIELSEIEGLGVFVELEILSDRDDEATVAEARSRLLAALERIGIGTSKIESRYYTEMLARLGRK